MASRKIFFVIFLLYLNRVESASLWESSYEYVMNFGKSVAPSILSFLDCFGENDVWGCTKEKAGRLLDKWEGEVDKQRRSWQEDADLSATLANVPRTTASWHHDHAPSSLGREVEECLTSLADIVQHGIARALTSRGHHDDSTVNLAISTSGGKKKKKKTKPPKIHLVPVKMEKMKEDTRGFSSKAQTWSIGDKLNETNARKGRGIVGDLWAAGEKGIDSLAKHVLEEEELEKLENVENKEVGEMRGKKKKKKKAILKLLILGAVLKAKIGTLLQILSFKLQVKFFLIALVGLGINLARFWLDLKKTHQPPQKVIYYEHAQHQHHYDHEEEAPGWGPWSRSLDPEQIETGDEEIDFDVNLPYHAHKRNVYSRPLIAHAVNART